MMAPVEKLAAGTGGSVLVESCQVCESTELESVLFLGFLPPVNTMQPLGVRSFEQAAYPAELLQCPRCRLVQLGLTVDPAILFPPHYAYTSGTTRILRENFAQLAAEVVTTPGVPKEGLVVDIGANDGTLLSNFPEHGYQVCGIEPTNAGLLAEQRGIPTVHDFFGAAAVDEALNRFGRASIVTATNVFAHIEDVHGVVRELLRLLDDDGVFISESHYLGSLVDTLQYDTVYHEHLRYYSLHSLRYLLEMHGLSVFHARRIPTHGGSIRVYARRGVGAAVSEEARALLADEESRLTLKALRVFRGRVTASKLALMSLLHELRAGGARIGAVGAPSRASTLVNYVGLDEGILEYVLEVPGSYKVGKYMPGTLVPVIAEDEMFRNPPEYLLMLSWHIADELMPKLREKGFGGGFIVPLPEPRVITPL